MGLKEGLRIQENALLALQEAAEAYVVRFLPCSPFNSGSCAQCTVSLPFCYPTTASLARGELTLCSSPPAGWPL